ncbi:MAG: putative ABC exporter domain-containing protein, partial [Clostridia bacterium]|nr:putative ABC exporter domain-containing protein [Clostridia bacterium]
MSGLFYYIRRSFVNQIKKLFRSAFVIFLLCCVLFGVVIGLGASLIADKVTEDSPTEETEDTPTEETEENDLTPEEIKLLAEAVSSLVIISVLVVGIGKADQKGSSIFLPADVNLLFASPKKPQSVLLFRLICSVGAIFFINLYLIFQLPNLILNAHFPIAAAIALPFAFSMLLVLSQIRNVFLCVLTSVYPKVRKALRPITYALSGAVILGYGLYFKGLEEKTPEAISGFFTGEWQRMIPFYGWLKGLVFYIWEGKYLWAGLCFLLLLLGGFAIIYFTWKLPADFYEEAMTHTEENAAKLAQAAGGVAKRKKDRAESVKRDGLSHGKLASTFFFRVMYNRFRFAKWGLFTKTNTLYLMIAVGYGVLCRLAIHTNSLTVFGLIVTGIAFFRALGNPFGEETEKPWFFMAPASSHAKVFYVLLSGSCNTALDLLPAFLAVTLITGGS